YARHFLRRVRFSDHDPDQAAKVEEYRQLGYPVEPCQYAADTTVVTLPTKDILVDEVEALGHPATTVESSDEISVHDQLSCQAAYQPYYGATANSFSVDLGPAPPLIELQNAVRTWLASLTGTTVLRDLSPAETPCECTSEADSGLK